MESREQIEDYYRKRLSKDYQGDFWQPRYHRILEILATANKNARILDVGCGAGDLLLMLKKRGFKKIEGLDFSYQAKKFAKKRGLLVTLCNFEKEIPKFNDKFDYLICADTLEHIFDPVSFLIKIKTLLGPKGKLIVTVPNAGWYLNGILLTFFPRFLRLSPAFGVWTHCNQFTTYTLGKLLERVGFKIVKISGVSFVQTPPKQEKIWRKIFKLIARLPIKFTDLFANPFPAVFSSHLIILAAKK